MTTKCHGIYNHSIVSQLSNTKPEEVTKGFWVLGRNNETDINFDVQCTCCNTYDSWKSTHPSESVLLQEQAAKLNFECFPIATNEVQGSTHARIMRSTSCTGAATGDGDHPYQCNPCHTLIKLSSILN